MVVVVRVFVVTNQKRKNTVRKRCDLFFLQVQFLRQIQTHIAGRCTGSALACYVIEKTPVYKFHCNVPKGYGNKLILLKEINVQYRFRYSS